MSDAEQPSFAEKRRILQLETLNDLAVALYAHRPEQELVDELLERVCAVLDPAAAVAVTRDRFGSSQAMAVVGWQERPPDPEVLLAGPLWHELLASGRSVALSEGELAGRPFRSLLATPIAYRGVFLGFLAVLDKELRGGESEPFASEDRRFLVSMAALAGVALDGARQHENLQAQRDRLEEENRALKESFAREVEGHRIIAHAPAMREALRVIERIAPRGVSVVIRGESGTGKELAARLLHVRSGRSGPLVAVNCSSMPESLLESELFGIEHGVATGVEKRRGKFEIADGGSLFLDEVGDLEPSVQVKLLRALQEREIVRVGGQEPRSVDVRLVAATHQDLESLVANRTFREDLYYRLKGVEIHLPPLRERREDIPHLVRHFMADFCNREGIPLPRIQSETIALLLSYDFPGNVRELQNLMEAAVSLCRDIVGTDLVRSLLGGTEDTDGPRALDLKTVEAGHIGKVLRMTGGNKSRAARILGVDRRTLQRKGF
ncbi:MAG: sigma 54-interacting transcriptional regulator [Acidobacteriota bacterium]|nr:sigma 54-interacting transcriptional regulator [Acidobacteriota bacterium]